MSYTRTTYVSAAAAAVLTAAVMVPGVVFEPTPPPVVAAVTRLPFHYEFATEDVLEEAPNPDASSSPYFWLNSGGQLRLQGGEGSTVSGETGSSRWSRLYKRGNPVDTDDGAHPQNLFRLFTRQAYGDVRQEAYFHIDAYRASSSPNRNESNGLLLIARATDSANLYYAGLRVDGHAVIKKKIRDKYHTLDIRPFVVGDAYDRIGKPNLLPTDEWIGVRTDVENLPNGAVRIVLLADVGRTGNWHVVAEATDDGVSYGGPAYVADGRSGIRTDFMDVRFDDFVISELNPSGNSQPSTL